MANQQQFDYSRNFELDKDSEVSIADTLFKGRKQSDRAKIIIGLGGPIYQPKGLFYTRAIDEGKRKNMPASKLLDMEDRIDTQMDSAKLAIYWLLDKYLLDDTNEFAITAIDLRVAYARETIAVEKVKNVALPYDNARPGISSEAIRDRPNAYSTSQPVSNIILGDGQGEFKRVILIDYVNALNGLTRDANADVFIPGVTPESNSNVDYKKFETYLYDVVARRDPDALYIFIKPTRGLRQAHSFVHVTDNVLEYNLRLPKGDDIVTKENHKARAAQAGAAAAQVKAGRNFTEYDDYVMIGLVCIFKKLIPNLDVYVISADNFDWFMPARDDKDIPDKVYKYFGNDEEGYGVFPVIKYYSPRRMGAICGYRPHANNSFEEKHSRRGEYLTVRMCKSGSRSDIQDIYTVDNFYTNAELHGGAGPDAPPLPPFELITKRQPSPESSNRRSISPVHYNKGKGPAGGSSPSSQRRQQQQVGAQGGYGGAQGGYVQNNPIPLMQFDAHGQLYDTTGRLQLTSSHVMHDAYGMPINIFTWHDAINGDIIEYNTVTTYWHNQTTGQTLYLDLQRGYFIDLSNGASFIWQPAPPSGAAHPSYYAQQAGPPPPSHQPYPHHGASSSSSSFSSHQHPPQQQYGASSSSSSSSSSQRPRPPPYGASSSSSSSAGMAPQPMNTNVRHTKKNTRGEKRKAGGNEEPNPEPNPAPLKKPHKHTQKNNGLNGPKQMSRSLAMRLGNMKK